MASSGPVAGQGNAFWRPDGAVGGEPTGSSTARASASAADIAALSYFFIDSAKVFCFTLPTP